MSATDQNALIRLRNGKEAPRSAVMTSWVAIKSLADQGDMNSVIALYEARELARDPRHALWGGTADVLINTGLLARDGTMHGITRDVILSAVIGDETGLSVTWPTDAPPGDGASVA